MPLPRIQAFSYHSGCAYNEIVEISSMNKAILPPLLCMLLCGASFARADEGGQRIEIMQRHVEKLAAGGLDTNNYHLSKARAWLDMAFTEYHDKDESGVIAAAVSQAETLLDALEKKQASITMDTPQQLTGSVAVRPDLLEQIAALKKHDKFICGQSLVAEAEVHLVWAGHEQYEYGTSHAQSYLRNTENLIYEAQVAMDNCAEPPPLQKITLSGDAMFKFGKTTLNSSALWRLDSVIESIKSVTKLDEVLLTGHTDLMQGNRRADSNQVLSEQRAESIKQYLVSKGIPEDKIRTRGAGSSQPLVQCSAKLAKAKRIACLQPNRRVEIILRGSK